MKITISNMQPYDPPLEFAHSIVLADFDIHCANEKRSAILAIRGGEYGLTYSWSPVSQQWRDVAPLLTQMAVRDFAKIKIN